ncbi:hypothetical protein P8452_39130 [Trifolium repens]|nr:hypothetical protein P8452_39130 [Trifolium repens]
MDKSSHISPNCVGLWFHIYPLRKEDFLQLLRISCVSWHWALGKSLIGSAHRFKNGSTSSSDTNKIVFSLTPVLGDAVHARNLPHSD